MSDILKLSILYDSEAHPSFKKGWGFSTLISCGGKNILFDCGWDGHLLRHNIGRLGLTFQDIDFIVLSHSHWDHVSGIIEILHDVLVLESIEVILPENFSRRLKNEITERAKLREINAPQEIVKGVHSTGVLGNTIKEQSLVISHTDLGIVITGCAHPGIPMILERAREIIEPKWLLGGFHDLRADQVPPQIEKIIMCHCTKDKKELLNIFGSRAEIGAAGAVFEFEV